MCSKLRNNKTLRMYLVTNIKGELFHYKNSSKVALKN